MNDKKTILIIDDDADLVEIIRTVLEQNGYTVLSASNGTEGLTKVETRRPDLIILDVMMDTVTEGFQVSYKLKNNPKLKDIPILMLTSVSQHTGYKFSKDKDGDFIAADEFCEKPIQPKDLLTKVEKLLRK
ncbi:MAG: response regulator [Deltaproteobacteria bacterium]|nr:response regulator [Deltaproteobacteria bacterium]